DRRSTPRRPAGWRPAAAAGGCGGWCGSREAPELVRARLRQQRLDRRELQQLGAATEQRHIGIDAAQVGALALSPFGLLAPAAGRIAQCHDLGLLAAEALGADQCPAGASDDAEHQVVAVVLRDLFVLGVGVGVEAAAALLVRRRVQGLAVLEAVVPLDLSVIPGDR